MSDPKYRVNLYFANTSDANVDQIALNVIEGMGNNVAFPNPPVRLTPPSPPPGEDDPLDLTTLRLRFSGARVAAANGGTHLTALKNQQRELVVDALHKLAMYVQTVARHDLAKMLSSGFEVSSTNRTPVPLDKPAILALVNEASGELLLRGTPVLNAKAYEVQASTDGGKTWVDLDTSTRACRITLAPVTPGVVYTVRFRAVGGSKKFSEWSDPVSHMAT